MSEPGVQLDFAVHWCARHLEPFRARWPEGAGVAMVKLFELAVADDRLIDRAPKDADGKAKTSSIDALLREHAPLCCWLGDERMAEVYAAAGRQAP